MGNKFNNMQIVSIDELTPENIQDLYDCEYDLPIDNLLICNNCNSVISADDIVDDTRMVDSYEDYWDYARETPEQRSISYEEDYRACPICNYGEDELDEFETSELCISDLFDKTLKGLEDYTGTDFIKALEQFKNKLRRGTKMENKLESKMNLQEATIKALYDGLKDNTNVEDVEGLVDDVLVVTDPEITTDEYNEVIERANEIVEDTPEGDIPLDPTYLGEYLQICPICGGSFVEDHILEAGTTCPICYETPEAFVMVGKLEAEESVAEDNGLVTDTEPELQTEPVPLNDLGNEQLVSNDEIDVEEEPTIEEEPVNEPEEPTNNRVRGARLRRNRDVASKEIPTGNKLAESSKIEETRTHQAILKRISDNEILTYDYLYNIYKKTDMSISFDELIQNYLNTGKFIDLRENKKVERKDPEEDFEIDEKMANKVDGIKMGDVVASYHSDTNTIVFYNEVTGEDEDTIVYRNETPDEIREKLKSLVKTETKELVEDNSDNVTDDYTVELIFEDKIRELKENSAFTWEGMSWDKENLKAIVQDLKENTNIKLPVNFYLFDGRTMNKIYGLTGANAYMDKLSFVAIDLDNWSSIGNLPTYKMQVGAKWLDDIVNNNELRQNGGSSDTDE